MNKLVYMGLTLMLLTCCLDGDGSWPYIVTILGIFCIAGGMMLADSLLWMRRPAKRVPRKMPKVHRLQAQTGQAKRCKI
jgi:hypothetical protein